MKALSGYAEWVWLMAMNWKDIENRNWSLYKKDKTALEILGGRNPSAQEIDKEKLREEIMKRVAQ